MGEEANFRLQQGKGPILTTLVPRPRPRPNSSHSLFVEPRVRREKLAFPRIMSGGYSLATGTSKC